MKVGPKLHKLDPQKQRSGYNKEKEIDLTQMASIIRGAAIKK